MLLGTLDARLLGNMLSGKGVKPTRWGQKVITACDKLSQLTMERLGWDRIFNATSSIGKISNTKTLSKWTYI